MDNKDFFNGMFDFNGDGKMSVFEKLKNGEPVDMMTQKERLDYLVEEFKAIIGM